MSKGEGVSLLDAAKEAHAEDLMLKSAACVVRTERGEPHADCAYCAYLLAAYERAAEIHTAEGSPLAMSYRILATTTRQKMLGGT